MWDAIGTLFYNFGALFPRIMHVKPYELGIKFIWGKEVKIINPGWSTYWPISTQIDIIPIVRQIQNLPHQTLTTRDNKSIIVSGVVIYQIYDIKKYMLNNFDTIESVTEIARSCLKILVSDLSFEEIRTAEVPLEDIQEAMESMGLEVEALKVTDIAQTRVINLVNAQAVSVPFDDSK